MKGVRVGIWMTGLNVLLILLLAAGTVPSALVLLRSFAAESASARVQLAASGALEGLRVQADELLTVARILAERPTLHRLVSEADDRALSAFLARFQSTSHLDGCAVRAAGRLVVAEPAGAVWDTLDLPAGESLRFFPLPHELDALSLAASVPLAPGSDDTVLCYRRIDRDLPFDLATRAGLPARLLLDADGVDLETRNEQGDWIVRRYLAREIAGYGVGVEVKLPAAAVRALLRPAERNFLLATFAVILLAIGAGALASRRFARPLAQLRSSAARIGKGDLASPVAAVHGYEAGALAATMEQMRLRIQATTAELHQREAEARALLEGMVEGVFAVDHDRRIEYISAQAAAALGVVPEQVIGRFCGDVLRPVTREGMRPCADACPIIHARSFGRSRAVEHLDLAGGRRSMVITSAAPAGGRQVQLLRDETETETARRSRDAVLANVSHELKTPLSAQMASIQLLQEAIGEDAPFQVGELIDSLERSTLRLSNLIDNLLESVRIETGRVRSRVVEMDLRAVVSEAEATLSPLFRQRGQESVNTLPDDLAPIRGDPVQFLQVFVNLLANAHKFAPEGSLIRIGGSSDSTGTCVWVEDSGPGIASTALRSVFEYSYRADPGLAEGMGLGLWIVKSIVERHSGTVEAEASSDGGARFTVRIPRKGPA